MSKTIKLWDVNSAKQLHTLESNISKISYSPDGKSLISSGSGGVKVWNVQTENCSNNLLRNRNISDVLPLMPAATY